MSDVIDSLAGTAMFHLKQDIAYLRQCLAECSDDEQKKVIRRELMEKETHYNILADRQRMHM